MYENGKNRRYNLLFAVTGGAFAAVLAIKDPAKHLGSLSIKALSVGMVIFTIIMCIDIFTFGFNFRSELNNKVFGQVGWFVLTSLCLLIVIGWLMVGSHDQKPCQ